MTAQPGGFQWQYLVGNGGETFDPAFDDDCTWTSDEFTNRFIFVEGLDDITLDVVCFNSCTLCYGSFSNFNPCDGSSVDFGEAAWGHVPDGEQTFFDSAYVNVAYNDDVHLLVPSFASDLEPETPLDAPIDSVVIIAVLLVDTLNGDTLTFAELGLDYECNNLGDCTDPCTFLGGGQYCASFSGVPNQTGEYILSMQVNVWATVFGFPLVTPYSLIEMPFYSMISDGFEDCVLRLHRPACLQL